MSRTTHSAAGERPLRVTLCPVNTAGVPWTLARALRGRGVDARLVVFERYALHPEADVSLDRTGGFVRRQATQWSAFARLAPQTDVFHFVFGLTLVPRSLQFPALRLLGKKSVMHYLGSDIRGKTPEQLAFGKKAGAEIVGSYDAIRWVPEAEVIPPGIDVARITPAPPSDRVRPVILHAPSSRRRKGTEHVVAAVEGLDADLEIVEGLHHDEAFERFRNADIVVDQLNAGWYGLFAIECMALGKPVVTFLHDEAVRRTERAFETTVPIVSATAETLREQTAPAGCRRRRAQAPGSRVTGLRRARPRPGPDHRPPARRLRSTLMALSGQLKRLGKHSAIYGLGGLVSRILAVLLLPLYTRYLTTSDYGQIETLIALVTVLTIVLQFGISSAFFRFYFDAEDDAGRRLVLRTSFWFTMTMATLGLVVVAALADPIAQWLFGDAGAANLVRASAVALWAQLNYMQLTNLFRVEERSVAFVLASLTNILITVGATLVLVVALDKGPLGVIVGNFTGTLVVYLALLGYRREQLGLQLSRPLLRQMNHFGLPLVPSALLLWVTNFSDRFFLVKLTDTSEVGLYSVGVRVASAMVLLLTAFRMAWPAFAYSIKNDDEAKQTYAWVLTYLVLVSTWIATATDAALAVDRRVADDAEVRERLSRRRAAVLRGRLVRRLHRARDRDRPGAANAVQLGDHRRRGSRQRRPQPDADPALRDDGRGDCHRRRLLGDVPRHGLVVATGLPRALPVAARGHGRGGGHRPLGGRQARRRGPAGRGRAQHPLPARTAPARVLPPGRAQAPAGAAAAYLSATTACRARQRGSPRAPAARRPRREAR